MLLNDFFKRLLELTAVILFPLGNEFLHVKQIIYVLVYFMYSYLQFSLTSAASAIRMAAKWYQKVVSRHSIILDRHLSCLHEIGDGKQIVADLLGNIQTVSCGGETTDLHCCLLIHIALLSGFHIAFPESHGTVDPPFRNSACTKPETMGQTIEDLDLCVCTV